MQTMEAASHQAKGRSDIIALVVLSLVWVRVQKVQYNLKTSIFTTVLAVTLSLSCLTNINHGILAGQIVSDL